MAKKRTAVSTRTRFDVFKRDGFRCQYCGQSPPQVVLEIDHILAVANGGGNEDTNLLTACKGCNGGKSDKPLTAIPEAIETQLAEQIERRQQLEAYNAWLMEARERADSEAYKIGTYWCDQLNPSEKGKWVVSAERLSSIKTFLKRLPGAEVYDAIDIAFSRIRIYSSDQKAWKYFCGVCWNKIGQRQGGDSQ